MQLTLIKNSDRPQSDAYKIARVIYAQTGATSLRVVEAMASMISNAARASGRTPLDIASDVEIFDSSRNDNLQYEHLDMFSNNRAFQMCVRVVRRMLRGALADSCNGAVRFHHADCMPQWAVARGYIADIDGLLFYL